MTPETEALCKRLDAWGEYSFHEMHQEKARALFNEAAAKLREMAGALEPFVSEFEARRDAYIRRYPRHPAVGANNFDAMPDAWRMENSTFTIGMFRRARAALGGSHD